MKSVCVMPLLRAMLLSSSAPLSEPLTYSPHCCEQSHPKHATVQVPILQGLAIYTTASVK